ncbi:MAG: hypothetical protein ACKVQA_26225 [Burkholderiales bacterium]
MKEKYYFIPCNNMENLRIAIYERAVELGYSRYDPKPRLDGGYALNALRGHIKTDHKIAFDNIREHGVNAYSHLESILVDPLEFLYTDKYVFVKPKDPIMVKLNKDYIAEVSNVIKVGCQEFSCDKVAELAKAIEDYKNG